MRAFGCVMRFFLRDFASGLVIFGFKRFTEGAKLFLSRCRSFVQGI